MVIKHDFLKITGCSIIIMQCDRRQWCFFLNPFRLLPFQRRGFQQLLKTNSLASRLFLSLTWIKAVTLNRLDLNFHRKKHFMWKVSKHVDIEMQQKSQKEKCSLKSGKKGYPPSLTEKVTKREISSYWIRTAHYLDQMCYQNEV